MKAGILMTQLGEQKQLVQPTSLSSTPPISKPALDNSDKRARGQANVTHRLFLAQLTLEMIFQGNAVQSYVSKLSTLAYSRRHC